MADGEFSPAELIGAAAEFFAVTDAAAEELTGTLDALIDRAREAPEVGDALLPLAELAASASRRVAVLSSKFARFSKWLEGHK